MLARIRKAVVAGVGAGLSAAVSAVLLAASGGLTHDEVAKAVGAGVAALVAVGWATWRVRNKMEWSRP